MLLDLSLVRRSKTKWPMQYSSRPTAIYYFKIVNNIFVLFSDELRYKSDPVLVKTIRTKASKKKMESISGLTILYKELFVVSNESSKVEVYDSMKFSFSRQWKLRELITPRD